MDHDQQQTFNANSIREYFAKIGELAQQRGEQFEIAVYGGSALALMFDWRLSTMDIDYSIVRGADASLSRIANEAAELIGRPKDGFRSDVEIFASDYPELIPQGDYPSSGNGGLRVLLASPEYILTMKILSMRDSVETQDCRDVWNLLDSCKQEPHTDPMQYMESMVKQFYPRKTIPARNRHILTDILSEKAQGKPYRNDIGW